MSTAERAGSDRESQALVMLGFGTWFALWWAGAIIVTIAWGLRHRMSRIALGAGLALTLAAIVVPLG